MRSDDLSRWVRAGLLTGITDGLFATVLAGAVYGSGVMRLWQGVAFTLLGPKALEGGAGTALVGVGMHFGVAFGWSAVFVFVVMRSAAVRRVLASPWGAVKVAAVYGPLIWLVMSLVVVPLLVHRPPTLNLRWWVQLLGHFPFVGLPIAIAARAGLPRPA